MNNYLLETCKDNLSLFIPLVCAECNDYLLFSGASFIPVCYILFPSTLFHQLVFHPPSLHPAICFLVYLSAVLVPNLYIIFFGELDFLPFSVQAQTNIIYLTLLSLLQWVFKPLHKFLYWLIFSNFLFHCHILGLKFFCTVSLKNVYLLSFSRCQYPDFWCIC